MQPAAATHLHSKARCYGPDNHRRAYWNGGAIVAAYITSRRQRPLIDNSTLHGSHKRQEQRQKWSAVLWIVIVINYMAAGSGLHDVVLNLTSYNTVRVVSLALCVVNFSLATALLVSQVRQ
jgi:hypothetical protein